MIYHKIEKANCRRVFMGCLFFSKDRYLYMFVYSQKQVWKEYRTKCFHIYFRVGLGGDMKISVSFTFLLQGFSISLVINNKYSQNSKKEEDSNRRTYLIRLFARIEENNITRCFAQLMTHSKHSKGLRCDNYFPRCHSQ